MKPSVRLSLLVVAFGGTGAAGLLAEQSFEKLLGTLLGTATPAGAVVLATYFGGLMVGGLAYGRVMRRRRSGLRVYAVLEGWIAIACAALALSSASLPSVFAPVLVLGAGRPALLTVVRLAVAASWLLPITIPMGATFPAVVDALDRLLDVTDPQARARARGAWVSALYTCNLLGAIVAAAMGPYFVLARFGLDGTLWVAASLDVSAVLVSFGLAAAFEQTQPSASQDDPMPSRPVTRGDALARLALPLVAALSGLVLFSLEVAWTHLIGTVIGSSVYAFATMLTVVLAGLGLGAAAAGFIATRLKAVRAYLPGLALVAAWAALSVGQQRWPGLPHELAEAGHYATTFAGAERARATLAVIQLLPASTLLGMVYPLLLRLDVLPASNVGRTLGRLGAFNAMGSVTGAFATLFVWIPLLGAESTLRCLAALCLAAGTLLVLGFASNRWLRPVVATACALGLVATARAPRWDRLALTSGEQVYLMRSHVGPRSVLRFFAEDPHGGFTTVTERPAPNGYPPTRVLLSNGKFLGNDTGEMDAQDAFALIPTMFVEDWRDALVIGLGTGRSAHVVASMGFDHTTIAEISPGIVDAARTEFRHINGDVLGQSNVTLALTDARNHLLLDPTQYGLISIELSSVWIAGATNLYAREFYELCKRRLGRRGILQQWIQVHHIGLDEVDTVIATVRDVFPIVSFYFEGGQGIVIASNERQESQPGFFDRLERLGPAFGVTDAGIVSTHLHASRLLGASDVDRMLAATKPRLNTDANRFLEYATPKHVFENNGATNVRSLARWSSFTPQEVSAAAGGALADAARHVGASDVARGAEPK